MQKSRSIFAVIFVDALTLGFFPRVPPLQTFRDAIRELQRKAEGSLKFETDRYIFGYEPIPRSARFLCHNIFLKITHKSSACVTDAENGSDLRGSRREEFGSESEIFIQHFAIPVKYVFNLENAPKLIHWLGRFERLRGID